MKPYYTLGALTIISSLAIMVCFNKKQEQPKVAAALKEVHRDRVPMDGLVTEESVPLGPGNASTSPGAGVESGQLPSVLSQQALAIESQVVESLSGNVNPNLWMDIIAKFTQFPINPDPVADWRDEDEDAHEFLLGADRVKAFLVIEKDEPREISIRVESSPNSLVDGVYRRDQALILYLNRDNDDSLLSVALQSYATVALGYNRQRGIEAYEGEFREGVIYQYESGKVSCFLIGIRDARPIKIDGDCRGDLQIDFERARLLNERASQLLEELKK